MVLCCVCIPWGRSCMFVNLCAFCLLHQKTFCARSLLRQKGFYARSLSTRKHRKPFTPETSKNLYTKQQYTTMQLHETSFTYKEFLHQPVTPGRGWSKSMDTNELKLQTRVNLIPTKHPLQPKVSKPEASAPKRGKTILAPVLHTRTCHEEQPFTSGTLFQKRNLLYQTLSSETKIPCGKESLHQPVKDTKNTTLLPLTSICTVLRVRQARCKSCETPDSRVLTPPQEKRMVKKSQVNRKWRVKKEKHKEKEKDKDRTGKWRVVAGIVFGDVGLSLFFVAGAVFGDVRSVTFCGFSWHLVTFGFHGWWPYGPGIKDLASATLRQICVPLFVGFTHRNFRHRLARFYVRECVAHVSGASYWRKMCHAKRGCCKKFAQDGNGRKVVQDIYAKWVNGLWKIAMQDGLCKRDNSLQKRPFPKFLKKSYSE